jgi:hypothetical protein
VFHCGEAPDLVVAHGGDLRAVDGPHDVRRVGDDRARMGLVGPRRAAAGPGAARAERSRASAARPACARRASPPRTRSRARTLRSAGRPSSGGPPFSPQPSPDRRPTGATGRGRPESRPAGRRPGPWAWGRRRSVGRLNAGVCAARRATWNDDRATPQAPAGGGRDRAGHHRHRFRAEGPGDRPIFVRRSSTSMLGSPIRRSAAARSGPARRLPVLQRPLARA